MAAAQAAPPKIPSESSSQPRKKRRKTPSTGAAEDCFSCTKRAAKCDRRRPYCSQCLEIGKECSGYRTVLTWGVGVASRGKLRGRTLPVAGSSEKAKGGVTSKSKRSSLSTSPQAQRQGPQSKADQAPAQSGVELGGKTISVNLRMGDIGQTTFDSLPANASNRNVAAGKAKDSPPGSASSLDRRPIPLKPTERFQRLHASAGGVQDDPAMWSSPGSTVSHGTFSDSSFDPPSYPHSPEAFPPIEPLIADLAHPRISHDLGIGHAIETSPYLSDYMLGQWEGKPQPDMVFNPTSNPIDLHPSTQILPNTTELPLLNVGNNVALSNCSTIDENVDEEFEGLELVQSSSVHTGDDCFSLIPRPVYDTPFLHLPPRMQYLLDFYNRAICPVLVAFDGPENPYRAHVLPLAMQNPGLQNAIAALVTNNMRMRSVWDVPRVKNEPEARGRGPERNFSRSTGQPSGEEQHYKTMSIDLLNRQLAVPGNAQDDSVLATLLILCLFHVCDSGFSKFKTQLAGVQKLLRMRGQTLPSNFVSWIEMFFAWFDVMTAAVNDRETQFQNPSFTDLSANLGALEQFSGCDGRLFKLIARLGRLNLLSQGRPVRDDMDPLHSHPGVDPTYDFCCDLLRDGFGNGMWTGQPFIPSVAHDDEMEPPDDRLQFWREWKDLRRRLSAWQMESVMKAPEDLYNMPTSHQDLTHISESFRYSALLYTERLARPHLPASSPNFQSLVDQSMAHIDAIGTNSCVLKFMLWPLFITGTECVDERHRDNIRDRCVEIQKESGFYNNLSGLDVLERVWKQGQHDGETRQDAGSRQAFTWRKAMDRVDGEYIVI